MKFIQFIILVLIFVFTQGLQAQIVEKAEAGNFALINAKVFTVSNGVIENGSVLIKGNVIEYVGKNPEYDASYKVIDCSGKHIYPGLIDASTQLGLVEVSAVQAANHGRELGDFNPHIRAFTGVDPNSVSIPVTRVNGVTTVISEPAGGVITGKSFLMNLYGYSADSMSVVADAALNLNFPSSTKRGWWDDRDEKKITEEFEKDIKGLNEFIQKAVFFDKMMQEYEANPSGKEKPDHDIRMEAMRDVVSGKVPVLINVNREKDILKAIEWSKKHDFLKVVLKSVSEGWRVADQIAEAGIPCIVGPVLRTPTRAYDNYARPYQNAGILAKAGVLVAITADDVENTRNVVYNAAYAGVYGMGMDEALRSITINPAKIFGADNQIGSLEAGKKANVIVTDGDVFETMTNVDQVFIDGLLIPGISRHTMLYQEFINRDVR